jgi:hypothetical protein
MKPLYSTFEASTTDEEEEKILLLFAETFLINMHNNIKQHGNLYLNVCYEQKTLSPCS